VVGLKPSYGRIPIEGVFPFSPSFDTLGFFTADVSDALVAYQALTGESPAPPSSPVRVGLLPDLRVEAADPEMLAALEQAGRRLESESFQPSSAELPSCCEEAFDNHWTLVTAEASVVHRSLFRDFGESYPPKLSALIQRGGRIETSELERIQLHRKRVREEIERLFADFHVLLCPSAPGGAPAGIGATGDPRFSLIWTYTGLPTLTLPYCLSQSGLPLGLQLVAPPNREADLLAIGREMESVFEFSRRHPLRLDWQTASRRREGE
jgi:Asp-tRNA(Asn)/Glu-tRNA(Gln) amidotransferase A subunit family amidase